MYNEFLSGVYVEIDTVILVFNPVYVCPIISIRTSVFISPNICITTNNKTELPYRGNVYEVACWSSDDDRFTPADINTVRRCS